MPPIPAPPYDPTYIAAQTSSRLRSSPASRPRLSERISTWSRSQPGLRDRKKKQHLHRLRALPDWLPPKPAYPATSIREGEIQNLRTTKDTREVWPPNTLRLGDLDLRSEQRSRIPEDYGCE